MIKTCKTLAWKLWPWSSFWWQQYERSIVYLCRPFKCTVSRREPCWRPLSYEAATELNCGAFGKCFLVKFSPVTIPKPKLVPEVHMSHWSLESPDRSLRYYFDYTWSGWGKVPNPVSENSIRSLMPGFIPLFSGSNINVHWRAVVHRVIIGVFMERRRARRCSFKPQR